MKNIFLELENESLSIHIILQEGFFFERDGNQKDELRVKPIIADPEGCSVEGERHIVVVPQMTIRRREVSGRSLCLERA